MSAISWHPTSTSVIPISEENMSDWKLSCRYRKGFDIDIWVHSDIRYPKIFFYHIPAFELKTIVYKGEHLTSQPPCCLKIKGCRIFDIGYKFIPISDIMSDSALFSPILEVLTSSSVRYRWSRISNKVPAYANYTCCSLLLFYQSNLMFISQIFSCQDGKIFGKVCATALTIYVRTVVIHRHSFHCFVICCSVVFTLLLFAVW
jgi:hypothetical protein